jgi:hypothetical protein
VVVHFDGFEACNSYPVSVSLVTGNIRSNFGVLLNIESCQSRSVLKIRKIHVCIEVCCSQAAVHDVRLMA